MSNISITFAAASYAALVSEIADFVNDSGLYDKREAPATDTVLPKTSTKKKTDKKTEVVETSAPVGVPVPEAPAVDTKPTWEQMQEQPVPTAAHVWDASPVAQAPQAPVQNFVPQAPSGFVPQAPVQNFVPQAPAAYTNADLQNACARVAAARPDKSVKIKDLVAFYVTAGTQTMTSNIPPERHHDFLVAVNALLTEA